MQIVFQCVRCKHVNDATKTRISIISYIHLYRNGICRHKFPSSAFMSYLYITYILCCTMIDCLEEGCQYS